MTRMRASPGALAFGLIQWLPEESRGPEAQGAAVYLAELAHIVRSSLTTRPRGSFSAGKGRRYG